MTRLPKRGQGGFTLVELLVAITVMPMVVGVIAAALIMVVHSQGGVSNRLADSADAQTTSAWFARDVQSASQITTADPPPSPALCGSGTTLALALSWQPVGLSQSVVSYWVVPVVSGPTTTYTVVRRFCTGGSSAPTQSITVARAVSAGQQPAAVTPAGSSAAAWTPAAGVRSVALTIAAPASAFTYQLAAAPRAWVPTSAAPWGGTPPLLLLLGSGPNVLSMTGGPNTVTVNGALVVDSPASPAISLANNTVSVSASGSAISFYDCNSSTPNGGACNNSPVALSGGATLPTPTSEVSIATSVPDPYANLAAPPDQTGTPVTCTESSNAYTCPGGLYTTVPSFGRGASSVTFLGSATFPAGAALTLSSIGTVIFNTGVYIFHGGLTVKSCDNVTANNVLFYLDGTGQLSFTNGPNSVSMSPMTTGTYANVAILQNELDTQPLAFSGTGSLTTDLDPAHKGAVDIPGAQLSIPSGGAFTVTVGNIVAASLLVGGGNSNLTIG